jgi:phage portal protein BeeE
MPETKASRTARVIRFETGAPARWTPRDYAALAREGFARNAVVHRAVKAIADNVGQCVFLAYEGARLADPHPLTDLLRRPNPRQEGAALLALGDGADVRELYALRPDRLRVVPGPDGWAAAYDYVVGSRSVRFEQVGDVPPILHLTLFNPLDDHYGLGALEAAAMAVDTHNAAATWNKALLDNSARPSGALVYDAAEGSTGSRCR